MLKHSLRAWWRWIMRRWWWWWWWCKKQHYLRAHVACDDQRTTLMLANQWPIDVNIGNVSRRLVVKLCETNQTTTKKVIALRVLQGLKGIYYYQMQMDYVMRACRVLGIVRVCACFAFRWRAKGHRGVFGVYCVCVLFVGHKGNELLRANQGTDFGLGANIITIELIQCAKKNRHSFC